MKDSRHETSINIIFCSLLGIIDFLISYQILFNNALVDKTMASAALSITASIIGFLLLTKYSKQKEVASTELITKIQKVKSVE